MNTRKRYRWTTTHGWVGGPEMGLSHRGGGPRGFEDGNIPLEYDFLAGALEVDARSRKRELWLGLVLGAGVVGLVISGWGVPLLAAMFCLAPVVGIALEIFSPSE